MITTTVATINDDHTDLLTSATRKLAEIMCFQEVWRTDLDAVLDTAWGVHQHDATDPAKANSAVVWSRAHYQLIDDGYELGCRRDVGDAMRDRWLAWVLLEDRATGERVYVVAGHRPPVRERDDWPEFDANSGRFVKSLAHPVIVGLDANQAPPTPLIQATGLRWHGIGIDGFLVSRGIAVTDLHRLPKGASDHNPVVANFTIPKETAMTNVQIYPGADRTTQWFADNFPGSRFVANCGVLHSTEGTSWPGYSGGASAPTLTAKPDIPNKRLVWRQHFPIDMSSRALRNLSGGVETNTAGAVQVELIGTTDPKHRRSWDGAGALLAGRDYIYWPEAPDWALAGAAKFMRWCNTEHGIKLQGPTLWLPYPESFGATRARMSFDQWRGFFGWCGHQHVPENVHGDVKLDFARLLELAKPTVAPPPAPESPRFDAYWEQGNTIAHDATAHLERLAEFPQRAENVEKIREHARAIRTLAEEFSTEH